MRNQDRRPGPIQSERLEDDWSIEQEPPNTQNEDMERQGRGEEDPDRDWDGHPQDEGDLRIGGILRRS
ncbi:MAG: hypothetical protein ACOZNI_10715 [Myxococcota bacterium]